MPQGAETGDLHEVEEGLIRAKNSTSALKHLLKASSNAPVVSPLAPAQPQAINSKGVDIKPSSVFSTGAPPANPTMEPPAPAAPPIDPAAIQKLKGTMESLLKDLNRTLKEKEQLEEEKKVLAVQLERAQDHVIKLTHTANELAEYKEENRMLREERRSTDESVRSMADRQQKELAELKARFLEEVEATNLAKKQAMDDIEESYSEALRSAQSRNQDLRETERKVLNKNKELSSEIEGLKAQLKQSAAEQKFLEERIEDERRNFMRFKDDVQGKHSEQQHQIDDQLADFRKLQSKYQAVLQELNHEKADKERKIAALREDLASLSESRDRSKSDFTRTARELEHSISEGREAKQHAIELFETVKELKDQLSMARDKIKAQDAYMDEIDRARAIEIEEMEELRKVLSMRERDLQESQNRALQRLNARKESATAKALQSSREVVESLDATLNDTLNSVTAGGEDEVEYEDDVEMVGLTVRMRDQPSMQTADLSDVLSWVQQVLSNALDVGHDRFHPCGIKRQVATESNLYSTNASSQISEIGEKEVHASFNIIPDEDHRAMAPDDLAAELVVQARDVNSVLLSNPEFREMFKHIGLHAAMRTKGTGN